MTNRIEKLAVLGLILAMTPLSAIAVPIGQGAFSGSETLINYDSHAHGTVITNQYSGLGAIFNNTNGTTTADSDVGGVLISNSNPNVAFVELGRGGVQEISFSGSVRLFGTWFETSLGESLILDVFGTSGLIEQVTEIGTNLGANLLEGFIGVQTNEDIVRVELRSSTDGFNFAIDDTRFEGIAVPEPSILALLGIGFIGMAAVRRPKKY